MGVNRTVPTSRTSTSRFASSSGDERYILKNLSVRQQRSGSTLRWSQRGHRPAHSSRASSIGPCTPPKSQTTTSGPAETLQRLRVAYWIDVGVAEVVDHVGEQLNELTPKCSFLLMRQNVDTYSLAHVVCTRAHNAHAHTRRAHALHRVSAEASAA